MATIQEYLELAEQVYAPLGQEAPQVLNWETQRWEWATWYGNGFQGGIFANGEEIIVAFSGTKGGLTTAPISQNSGNVRIGVNVIPNMAGSAMKMVDWARENAFGRQVSIVGHSLGGGLAQVVGNWTGCPFISFNGPGMKSHLKMSAFNILKPQQMLRSIISSNTDDTIGICFDVKGDFVATYGYHVGYEVILTVTGMDNKHSLDAIFVGLGLARRQMTPRQILSTWPSSRITRGRR